MHLMECSVLIDLEAVTFVFKRMNIANGCVSDRCFTVMNEYGIIRSYVIVIDKIVLYDSHVVFELLFLCLRVGLIIGRFFFLCFILTLHFRLIFIPCEVSYLYRFIVELDMEYVIGSSVHIFTGKFCKDFNGFGFLGFIVVNSKTYSVKTSFILIAKGIKYLVSVGLEYNSTHVLIEIIC